jgi:hypothetical protein
MCSIARSTRVLKWQVKKDLETMNYIRGPVIHFPCYRLMGGRKILIDGIKMKETVT